MSTPRTVLLRAHDAPAPTLVVDGAVAGERATRSECEMLAVAARSAAFDEHHDVEGLGVKTIVLLPPRAGVMRAEFFQGVAHGELMADSQQICLNSLACAVSAAADWYPTVPPGEAVLALMGDQSYVLRRRT